MKYLQIRSQTICSATSRRDRREIEGFFWKAASRTTTDMIAYKSTVRTLRLSDLIGETNLIG